ncbi:CPBP family intramembrane glutamic endopeptidase [Chondromyces apiculatus]|uniref:CAAX prenyl protease 2/Lysostaphin resistance protein A-like domain-containing protein n=1 Tax=Chondromyces apiculatus DSM 436 TaxID=1192034 RepID=A0A017T5B3_9BACT|nr:CPBP family intramembrane glutamic endopeptidase [Chondromyces apiculatus]EYF04424.1 Hypothetical protein CAP_4563 [Chondromyces apiculatus DSM 436]
MPRRWSGATRSTATLQAAGGYAVLSAFAVALTLVFRDGLPWEHPSPWIAMSSLGALATSALLGLVLALLMVVATRVSVPRFRWARQLHEDLRPVARDLSVGQILLLAGLSSLGEELLFRGLVTPLLGVLPSAVIFGMAHQIKGPSRWVWIGWAALVGVALGAIFALTGSLVGPLLAHAVVNAVNLGYLRSHDPSQVEEHPA